MSAQDTFVAQRRSALLDEQRLRLTGLAYRLLGSAAEAPSAVAQAARCWASTDLSRIADRERHLTALLTRICLARLRGRPRCREWYASRRLPEPVPEALLSLPSLLAMEALSPLERCAYVLRVVDRLSYADVAAALDRSEPAVRQLVRRARKRLPSNRTGRLDGHDALVRRFAAACRTGRLAPLVEVLGTTAVLAGDIHTSGPAPASREHTAALLMALLRRLPKGSLLCEEPVNGELGLVARAGGRPVCALALQFRGERVDLVVVVTNAAALGALAGPAAAGSPGRRMP